MTHGATRRTVLIAAGATGATALTAGCGGGADTPTGEETSAPDATAGDPLASTGDIPVGGGKIFKKEKVVVT
ncbi:hypothetical protein GCM10009601_42360 [Streptomyces thermospinosisporus]|uniref:Uncharacterized protein n=1 Tax=Streptomyces thermospinosisporus TaxID=161482 RepID=A0ABN1Z2C4_9ACTN